MKRMTFLMIFMLLCSCNNTDSEEAGRTATEKTLESSLLRSMEEDSNAFATILKQEFGNFAGKLVYIGKVTVRLWHPDTDNPEKSEYGNFLPPATVSKIHSEMLRALDFVSKGQSQGKLAIQFEGCESTGVLRLVGKKDLDASPQAVKECGFLVKNVKVSELRQFEFVLGENKQFIYVTTNVAQRPAVFSINAPFQKRVLLVARPDSWQAEIGITTVDSQEEYNPLTADGKAQGETLKNVLKLFNTPTSLGDASRRWYEKQVNIEARKPVIGTTLSAALATVGVSQIWAAGTALFTASAGGLTVTSTASISASAASSGATWLTNIAATWKLVAGFSMAASSAAEFLQVQRIIDLEGDATRRANMQFAYMVFQGASSALAMGDLVVSNPVLFKLVTRNYIKTQTFLTLAKQKAEFDKLALKITADSLKKGASSVTDHTWALFRQIKNISFSSDANFKQKLKSIVDVAQKHGTLVKAAGDNVSLAHHAAAELVAMNPLKLAKILNSLSEEAALKVFLAVESGNKVRQMADAGRSIDVIRTAKPLAEQAATAIAGTFANFAVGVEKSTHKK